MVWLVGAVGLLLLLENRWKYVKNAVEKGKKGKVVPVLNELQHYAMKAYGGVDV
jgi:hypothetical protein